MVRKAHINNADGFKNILVNAHRNYVYDIKIELPGSFDDIYMMYMFEEYETEISLLCKSIGVFENEIQDIRVEQAGRNITAPGKYIAKSPVVFQFYDTALQYNSEKIMLSELFRRWMLHWNHILDGGESETLDMSLGHNRRKYLEDGSATVRVSVYPGGYVDYKSAEGFTATVEQTDDFKDLNENLNKDLNDTLNNKRSSTPFDRYGRVINKRDTNDSFWRSFYIELEKGKLSGTTGELTFLQAMQGVGAGVTLHGIINIVMFGIYKGLTFAEALYEFGIDVKTTYESIKGDSKLQGVAAADGIASLFGTSVSEGTSLADKMYNRQYSKGLNPPEPEDLIRSKNVNKQMQTMLKSLQDDGIVQSLSSKLDSLSGEIKTNPNLFMNSDVLSKLQTTRDLINLNFSDDKVFDKILDVTLPPKDFISEADLDSVRKMLNNIIEASKLAGDTVKSHELERLEDLLNEFEEMRQEYIDRLDISDHKLEKYEKLLNEVGKTVEDYNIFLKKSEVDNYINNIRIKWNRSYFRQSRDVLKKILNVVGVVPRIINGVHNMKSLYNLFAAYNGWDDFVNMTELDSKSTMPLKERVLFGGGLLNFNMFLEQLIKTSPFAPFEADLYPDNLAVDSDIRILEKQSEKMISDRTHIQDILHNKNPESITTIPDEGILKNKVEMKYKNQFKQPPIKTPNWTEQGSGKGGLTYNDVRNRLLCYEMTYAYPSYVKVLDSVGHDKTGEQSLPTVEVHFNFFDLRRRK